MASLIDLARCAGLAACVALAACGGGGGGSAPADPAPALPAPVNGNAPPPAGEVGPIPADPANLALPRIEPYERTVAMAHKDLAIPLLAAATREPGAAPVADLGPLSATERQRQARAASADGRGRKAQAIGLVRAVPAAAQAPGWQARPDGGWVAALAVRSPGAAGLRLALQVGRLPAQARLTVAGTTGMPVVLTGQAVRQALAREAPAGPAGALHWLPAVAGDVATLAVDLPPGTPPQALALAVPQAAHLWWTHAAVTRASDLKIGESGTCNLDATCSPAYAEEGRAVARMEFIDGDSAFLCSGTLLADTARTGTPWFLTAHHCIGSQAAAATVSTYWFYRAAACRSDALDPAATQRAGGATLLHASAATDTAFLRLEHSPPPGAVHAGTLLGAPAVGSAVVGLHHPSGDLLKLAVGTLQSYATCDGTNCSPDPQAGGHFLSLAWQQGTTESGSSGSAAFAAVGARRYVVGHLFAGLASCVSPGGSDFYGRFDREYPALRQHLGDVPGT